MKTSSMKNSELLKNVAFILEIQAPYVAFVNEKVLTSLCTPRNILSAITSSPSKASFKWE